ncbi:hypothetical protein VLL09_04860 [Dehalococcoides mccartyi]|uniref:Uncharacterized protein n=1 Tax=Dehalococcoides mccartyi TaxID=61435 RepID=A0AB38Z819_9CHLR|nr:hypothetical protein [Dehalococcoides mccartyi]WRO06723.1 hypothetical protein VLL09_04860 [Dehalococcoides mccartyi]
MPYAMVPPGYRAVLLGSANRVEDLGTFAPLEESSVEGALFLVRLDFTEAPTEEALSQLEQAFLDAGVETWPGYIHVVYADLNQPSVYLVWQKGLAWIPIIIGLLVTVVLPPLLGSLIWLILPQGVKDMITGLMNMGMMLLVMFIMMQFMKPLTAQEKPKKVKTSEKPELEEAKT